ncbi:cytochrome C [bacterium]|nr:MAG: cytochrome C [bacterium]
MRRILPSSFYNVMSLSGAALSGISLGLIVFLFVLEYFSETSKPYMGIITLIILPMFMTGGIVIMIWGMLREIRRRKAGITSEGHLPKIDFNIPRHRTAFAVFSFGAILFLGLSAFGSYKAYEFTDSDQFCGEMCHTVMSPEYTAYQFSPHAKVGCAQCHIGSGAEWFVKAKISGSYQVYSVLFNKYARPIETPIENLRPAQQTCEQCHWPKHFFSEKQRVLTYYLSDEHNTKWTLNLLVKIGGGNADEGPTSGIHWHMNIANEITYAPIDRERQIIPWVRVRHGNGKESVYRSTEVKIDEEDLNKIEKRRMDCIDCHNRPTHIYHHPAASVNQAMSVGWIDPTLPFIKNITVEALQHPYATRQSAFDSIRIAVTDFYSTHNPDVLQNKKEPIERAIKEVQKIYSRNFFPEMKVSWEHYPDNIGHMYSLGCFRCHDGKHVNEEGKVLSRDCNTCHTLLAQEFEKGDKRIALGGVEYIHPVDVGNEWKQKNCSECHSKND